MWRNVEVENNGNGDKDGRIKSGKNRKLRQKIDGEREDSR